LAPKAMENQEVLCCLFLPNI